MDTKTQALINALAAQRNQSLDTIAQLVAELADRDAQIAGMKQRLEAAEKKETQDAPA